MPSSRESTALDSAQRLSNLIENLAEPLRAGQRSVDGPLGSAIMQQWHGVLGWASGAKPKPLPTYANAERMKDLAHILQMPERVRTDVLALNLADRSKQRMIQPLEDIHKWVGGIVKQVVANRVNPQYDTESVEFWREDLLDCSAEQERVHPTAVQFEAVRDLEASIEDLKASLDQHSDSLDRRVRSFIEDHLHRIEEALRESSFVGLADLQTSVTHVYGDLIVQSESLRGRVDENDGRWQKFWAMMERAAVVVTLMGAISIPGHVLQLRNELEESSTRMPMIEAPTSILQQKSAVEPYLVVESPEDD